MTDKVFFSMSAGLLVKGRFVLAHEGTKETKYGDKVKELHGVFFLMLLFFFLLFHFSDVLGGVYV